MIEKKPWKEQEESKMDKLSPLMKDWRGKMFPRETNSKKKLQPLVEDHQKANDHRYQQKSLLLVENNHFIYSWMNISSN